MHGTTRVFEDVTNCVMWTLAIRVPGADQSRGGIESDEATGSSPQPCVVNWAFTVVGIVDQRCVVSLRES